MRCQDVERILTEGPDARADAAAADDLERHLAACPACTTFQADLARIRGHFRGGTLPVLPSALDGRTRAAWRAEIDLVAATVAGAERTDQGVVPRPAPIPRWLWAALAALTTLTAIVVYPIFAAPEIVEPLSFQTAAIVALLLQNGMMLFFAPILLRKFKKAAGSVPDRILGGMS